MASILIVEDHPTMRDAMRLVLEEDGHQVEEASDGEVGIAMVRDRAPDVVEIGATFLAASAQRTPVNTEAKLLMLTHAFEVWGVLRVSLKTDARNERSRAAIERLGARYDGTLRRHMPAYGPGGGPRDSAFFSILSEEWPEVKSRLQSRLQSY